MYWDIEVTSEDEDEMIRKIAQKVHEHDLDMAAILMIESVKPFSYIGTQMGRFFFSPFLPLFGENIGIRGEKFFQIFEKRENVEKLIKAVEELTLEEEERKETEKKEKLERKGMETEIGETHNKKWWQRFLPFSVLSFSSLQLNRKEL